MKKTSLPHGRGSDLCRVILITWLFLATCNVAFAAEPEQVARELLETYGKRFDTPSYIPALALCGRLRFGELTADAEQRTQVERVLYPSAEAKPEADKAGCLIFAAMAHAKESAHREQSLEAVRRAADKLFDPKEPNRIRPPGSGEMSDAVFMIGPLLCEAGSLTGDARYFDGAVAYLATMRKLRQRDDGLYRHGHLCDAAWGRGNGFPAVGTAWCLSLLPKNYAGREEMLASYRRHMAALLPHQTATGEWRQVIDVPDAYPEFSCTAMIGFAIERGITSGWLERDRFQPSVDKAWSAMCDRIQPGGKLLDVCEGTGTQKSLDDYLRRKANRGVDDRGGAMALLFAVERMASAK